MIRGVVNAGREPTIPLRVVGLEQTEVAVTAVVDSGFSHHLALPAGLIAGLSLLRVRDRALVLADGSTRQVPAYSGVVDWHGAPRGVIILAVGTEPLVGMMLLGDGELWMECWPGGAVEITPAGPTP